LTGNGQKTEPP